MATWFLYQASNEKHPALYGAFEGDNWKPEKGADVPHSVCPSLQEGVVATVVHVFEGSDAAFLDKLEALDQIFSSGNIVMQISVQELIEECFKAREEAEKRSSSDAFHTTIALEFRDAVKDVAVEHLERGQSVCGIWEGYLVEVRPIKKA